MAAGIAGLEQVYTAQAAGRLNASGDRLRGELNDVAAKHGAPIQVMGQGSMLCFHPRRGEIRRPADLAKVPQDLRKLMHLEFNLKGIYVARRGFMSLSLPLNEADHAKLSRPLMVI